MHYPIQTGNGAMIIRVRQGDESRHERGRIRARLMRSEFLDWRDPQNPQALREPLISLSETPSASGGDVAVAQ